MLKTSTWVRDSHELFDYESPHLLKKTFKIQNTCKFKLLFSFSKVDLLEMRLKLRL